MIETGVTDKGAAPRRAALAGAVLAVFALSLVPVLRGRSLFAADNDSIMRLVEVRDLLSGQGWFDLTQYRMGPPGGFVMHWSRLVDAPLAGLVMLARALGATAHQAEAFALVAMPLALSAVALWAMIRAALSLGGAAALFPAAVIGAATAFYTGLFAPGVIDHHTPQAALALVVVMLFAAPRLDLGAGAAAGLAAAAMAAIGAETHPHVALAGIGAALIFLVEGDAVRRFTLGFAGAFTGGLALAMAVTIPPGAYGVIACDALSAAQAGPGIAGGLALAMAALATPRQASRLTRLAWIAAPAGLALAATFGLARPCLGDPLGGFDPLLRRFWLDEVEEARPLLVVLLRNPPLALGYAMPPLVALAVLAIGLVRGGAARRPLAVHAAILALSLAIAMIQLRGALFAALFAVAPLSSLVAAVRLRAHRPGAPATAQLAMAGAWLVSINMVWTALALPLLSRPSAPTAPAGDGATPQPVLSCIDPGAYGALAAQPPGTVFAFSNLGSAILANSGHRALAGPYHRNVAGLRQVVSALVASPPRAEAMVRASGATLVAICRGDAESRLYGALAPDGLGAALERGAIPDWLEPLAAGRLSLYRLAPPR